MTQYLNSTRSLAQGRSDLTTLSDILSDGLRLPIPQVQPSQFAVHYSCPGALFRYSFEYTICGSETGATTILTETVKRFYACSRCCQSVSTTLRYESLLAR